MASIRIRNNRYNVRYRVKGKQHEKSFKTYEEAYNFSLQFNKQINLMQFKDFLLTRFPETHSAHIPLQVYFETNCSIKEAYEMKISEINFETNTWKSYKLSSNLSRLLKRHINRITNCQMLFKHKDYSDYVNIYPTTGRRIQPNQVYYIWKVIKKEVKGV